MIARIILENFFSFGEPVSVELNPDINVLVGINGSGKSNFLKAIFLLSESITGEGFEKVFLKDWGGFRNVRNFKDNDEDKPIRLTFIFDKEAINEAVNYQGFQFPFDPVYQLTINPIGNTAYYLKESIFYIDSILQMQVPLKLMEMENATGFITITQNGENTVQNYTQGNTPIGFKTTEPVLRQISEPDRFAPIFTLKRAIETMAFYNPFDTTSNSPVRQLANYGTEEKLLSNANNLMSILNRIKNHFANDYDKIEEYIRKINPHFKDIGFDLVGNKFFMVLREQFLAKSIPIDNISGGTLQYLCLLAICFNPKRGSIICLDEPEIGLHPDMIHSIAEAFKAASRGNTQFIIATHSPLFLNDFELDDILIFEKNNQNQSIVSEKSADDFDNWNDNYLSGQLWLRGLIGGKRW
jgi:predicted ATPase